MLPIDFEGSNITLVKPEDWNDNQCDEMRARFSRQDNGMPFFLTAWILSKEDLEAIKLGQPIWLKICGAAFPPMLIFTINSEGVPNI